MTRLFLAFTCLLFTTSANAAPNTETAIFAGGCFWSIEGAFDNVPGVTSAVSGYTGGTTKNPTYEQVSEGDTGHVEAVKITYDPAKVSYQQLLKIYWHNADPFNAEGQFCDSGSEYRSEIFTTSDSQNEVANQSFTDVSKQLGKTPVTKIVPAQTFYPAEDYHQHFEQKNPIQYALYRNGCGRDSTTRTVWGNLATFKDGQVR